MWTLFPNEPGAAALGELVALALRGSWREDCPAVSLSPGEIHDVAPFLFGTGAAALLWRRLAPLPEASARFPEAERAYKLHALQAEVRHRSLERVLGVLSAIGIEPLLVKGWAVARQYTDPALRPYGDFDLCFRADEIDRARRAIAASGETVPVDYHVGYTDGFDRSFDDMVARSVVLPVGDQSVRVPGPEDHLRLLSMHALRHGLWRPLWVCDLAAVVESLPEGFDWDLCLAGSQTRVGWTRSVLAFAGEALGARLDRTPFAGTGPQLPSWFAPAVYAQWGSRHRWPTQPRPAAAILGGRVELADYLRHRWPDPIRATVHWRAPFDGSPRFPFQALYCIARSGSVVSQGTQLLAQRLSSARFRKDD